ncbi:MAG: PspC domain-containing protein [Ruminococcus sp.]|nr:PspC domain-containing protein [Ruminococcus sp.]
MKKTLYRINEGKMIAGVCMGLSEYFDVDVNVVRLATIMLSCAGGCGLIAYIAGAFLLPEK